MPNNTADATPLNTNQVTAAAVQQLLASVTTVARRIGPAVAYPDPKLTPGKFDPTVTGAQVSVPGYAKGVRDVNQAEKNQVFANYGIAAHQQGQYEVDHYVPLCLAGMNDISNLWPEPASPTPGFHEKDKVEDGLHALVADGKISLADAQRVIMTDWVAVYNWLQKNGLA